MAKSPNIFCDFLTALQVPHTYYYSTEQFENMPFKSIFGLSRLLRDYGVDTQGYKLGTPTEITALTPPFLANTPRGFVIVTGVEDDNITYMTEGQSETMPTTQFCEAWGGAVLCAFPKSTASEPDYLLHARIQFFMNIKRKVLAVVTVALLIYAFIAQHLYGNISAILATVFNLVGLYFTYLLVQKSAHIKNSHADRVCGVLQQHGCDDILASDASKFFGLFGWSEVGFAYFSISLLTLLLFPSALPWLALINVCCLPFTAWSIWYQRFRAHTWCTLCVSVQATLWLLFFSYLPSGWYHHIFPLSPTLFVLGALYLVTLLGLNAVMPLINQKNKS